MDTSDVLEAIFNRPVAMPQPPIQDDLTKFLLGLGATMKSFKPIRLAQVKFDIANIVGKAEIDNVIEAENETVCVEYLSHEDHEDAFQKHE